MTTIYFDGSEKRNKENKSYDIGVGIVVVNQGNVSSYSFGTTSPYSGGSEFIALAMTVETLRFHMDVRKARLFTDCEPVAHAKEHLHPGNYKGDKVELLRQSLDKHLYRPYGTDINALLAWLKVLNIEKLKGHSGIVYNEYADFLAKHGLNNSLEPFISFEEWVLQPKKYWNTETDSWGFKHFPFCKEKYHEKVPL